MVRGTPERNDIDDIAPEKLLNKAGRFTEYRQALPPSPHSIASHIYACQPVTLHVLSYYKRRLHLNKCVQRLSAAGKQRESKKIKKKMKKIYHYSICVDSYIQNINTDYLYGKWFRLTPASTETRARKQGHSNTYTRYASIHTSVFGRKILKRNFYYSQGCYCSSFFVVNT